MHEMSIVQNIVAILKDEMVKHDVTRLKRVTIMNGALAGVVTDAMNFAWTALTPGTELDGCELEVKEAPMKVRCGKCGKEYYPDDTKYIPCPDCDELIGHEVLEGKELYIDSIEPADEAEE